MNFRNELRGIGASTLAFALALFSQSATSAETVDQGKSWTPAVQRDFYARDQGSRLIPWPWISALKQVNGQPFMADSLDRYGYLPNNESSPSSLPIGFVVISQDGADMMGLTCSACHTRQIEVGGKSYRIDGGPAIADLGSFWRDLDAAVGKLLSEPATFPAFAQSVLGAGKTPQKESELRDQVQAWFKGAHAIAERGLPKDRQWGPGRLDAVGMILNRVAGLDIGPPPSFIIEDNIQPADAPVRPPFLWNAARQDKTQWPGFADNGDWLLGLARNLGEVYGVFGIVHPKKDPSHLLGVDYNNDSTAQYAGLEALEGLIARIGPPKWPSDWPLDKKLADAGREIFNRSSDKGGCAECHGVRQGEPRLFNHDTWATPVQDVGTDSREYRGMARQVKTGVLEGAQIPDDKPPFLTPPLKANDFAVSVLATAVKGAVAQHLFPIFITPEQRQQLDRIVPVLAAVGPQIKALQGAYHIEQMTKAAPQFAYESRVLEGIWAAAPYLHNASVPTLAELLKPAAERVKEFKVGPRYDIANVGLAVDQSKFDFTLKTTGCEARDSGDSHCGHEFGTRLAPEEKRALLEYLKTL
jgi:mono/diheme cytochrome c family protein